jgi:hypothetical protein
VGRGSYLPLFLVFTLLLKAISQGFKLGGSFLLLRPRNRLGGTRKMPPLPPCLLPFIIGTVGLPPCYILRHGDPPRSTVRIPKTLHKNVYALKKQKLT